MISYNISGDLGIDGIENSYNIPSNRWFTDNLSLYLQYCESKNLVPGTIVSYFFGLVEFFEWIDQNFYDISDIRNIRRPHIERHLIYLQNKISPRSIKTRHIQLKTFFNWAADYESFETDSMGNFITLIDESPMAKIRPPKAPKKETDFLSEQQVELLLDVTKKGKGSTYFVGFRRRILIYLLITTLLRKTEMTNIKISDIDLGTNEILVMGKGRKEKRVPIVEGIREEFAKYLAVRNAALKKGGKDHHYLWVNHNGLPMRSVHYVNHEINELQRLSGVHFERAVHIFRNTGAAWALIKGMEVWEVMHLGGWSSLDMLLHYTQKLKDYRKNATATFATSPGPKGFYPSQYLNDIEKCNDRTHKNPKQARYCMFCRKPV